MAGGRTGLIGTAELRYLSSRSQQPGQLVALPEGFSSALQLSQPALKRQPPLSHASFTGQFTPADVLATDPMTRPEWWGGGRRRVFQV
jgi:hypothetical protein